MLRVEVSDTGVGIEEDKIGQLFDPFTQADASTTRVYGGTGLGLAISREIVEALGGDIGLEPNEGGGVFWFTATFDGRPARPRTRTTSTPAPGCADVACWSWTTTTTTG